MFLKSEEGEMVVKDEIMQRLKELAILRTKPFCYHCYIEALSGRCVQCGSDDLMRLLLGVGCEYGLEWIIKEILSEIETQNTDELFEASVRSYYTEETKIGWLSVDTASAIKELDPISWNLAKNEWLDQQESEGNLMTFDCGSGYYDIHQLKMFLDSTKQDFA